MKLIHTPSPNWGDRREGATPDLIVIHYTAMRSADAACRVLCNPETEVSAHYLIDDAGQVTALVDEDKRAWHAGAGQWGAVTDVNSRSIGIELANPGDCPFAAAQMDALEELLAGIMGRWAVPAHRVIGHSDMAPGRKIDPGARFDWQRLARAGLSVWPAPRVGTPVTQWRAHAERFGYHAQVSDDVLLAAIRLRFRPRHQGPADATDAAILADLADRYPVDASAATA